MEFSGTYYKCTKCKHVWAYDDDACPECGCKEITDVYPIHNNDVEVGMRVSTKNGVKGYIHEFPDLHNVLIAFDGTGISFEDSKGENIECGGFGYFCFYIGCPENDQDDNPIFKI
jgi:hypothetical protein